MVASILVPLDGSALSEHALAMAQHLAWSSVTSLPLLQVISLRPELEALRGSGDESVTVLEMAQDAARRLREAQTARGQASLKGLAGQLQHAGLHVTAYPHGQHALTNISDAGAGHSTLEISCTGSSKEADHALCESLAACIEREHRQACMDRSRFVEGFRWHVAK